MPSNPLQRYAHGRTGECWALVTGATNGMGEEYAYQLAAFGFNIVLHGRSPSKLATVEAQIKAKHSTIQVRTVAVDASQFPPQMDEFEALFKEIKLTVLVNNVGIVSQDYPLLEEEQQRDLAAQLITNNMFPTLLASVALPFLKQHQPSLMINMASLGAWAPTPYLSPYSGAKAYMLGFSRSLYNEMTCENQQVDVVCLAPGQVISGMNEGPATTMMPTSEDWVKKALQSLGPRLLSKRPPPVIIPWGAHSWGARAMAWMPRSLSDSTVNGVTLDLRRKKHASSSAATSAQAKHVDMDESATNST